LNSPAFLFSLVNVSDPDTIVLFHDDIESFVASPFKDNSECEIKKPNDDEEVTKKNKTNVDELKNILQCDIKKPSNQDKADKETSNKPATRKLEILPDKGRKYYKTQPRVLKKIKAEDIAIDEVVNHKKAYNNPAMLLILWNTGQVEWCNIENAIIDAADLVQKYMDANKLSWDILG
jgi:hypothetical protein